MARLVIQNLTGVQELEVADTDGLGKAFKIPPAGGVVFLTEEEYAKAVPQLTSFVSRTLITYTKQADGEPQKVICATTAPVGLSGLAAIDGVTPVANDVILVKNQADAKQNGLYVAASGAWSRLVDLFNQSVLAPGLVVTVTKGTVNGDKQFMLTSDSVVIGTDNIIFSSAAGSAAGAAKLFTFSAPAAADVASVHAAHLATGANTFPGPVTNPDTARNLQVDLSAGWDGGDVVISGADKFNAAVTETFLSGSAVTRVGVKIFQTVTSIVKTAVGTTGSASVGIGNKLGIAGKLVSASAAVLFVDNAGEGATLDVTYNAFTPTTTVPDGSANYALIANVSA